MPTLHITKRLELQPLIPDELKAANQKIESELSQFQNVLNILRKKVSWRD